MDSKFHDLSVDELRQELMRPKSMGYKQRVLRQEAIWRIRYWKHLAEELEKILLGAKGEKDE